MRTVSTSAPALRRCCNGWPANGAKTIIVESPDRFARDLAVQLAGHDMLKLSASRSFLHRLPTSSPRTHPPPFWCARCWVPSLNSRRRAPLRNWRRLASASVSVRDGAREENPSVKQDPMLSPSLVSCEASAQGRAAIFACVSKELAARGFLNELVSLMPRSLWRACWIDTGQFGGDAVEVATAVGEHVFNWR